MARPLGGAAKLRLAVLIASFGTLVLGPASASAALSHTLSSTFAGSGSSALSGPTGVAIDQTTNDVYVTDPGNHRVEKFDSAGNFILMFGKGVDATSGADVCTAGSGDTCQAGSSGTDSGEFVDPAVIAVDATDGPSSGDVYVGDSVGNEVQKFDSSGHLISGWGIEGQKDGSDSNLPLFGPINGIDVDSNGNLWISGSHYTTSDAWEYDQAGNYMQAIFNGGLGIRVDPLGNTFSYSVGGFGSGPPNYVQESSSIQVTSESATTDFVFDIPTGELYQDEGSEVAHYSVDCDPSVAICDPVDKFGSGNLNGAIGIAVDWSTHAAYVANTGANDVAIFGDARPILTPGQPSDVGQTSVTLTGHIDPAGRGDITACHFEYGFDRKYGQSVPCTPDPGSGSFSGPTDVSATITGLSPGTADHYRLVATNANDATRQGADQTFITTQAPAINGLAASNLTATTADLNAQVNSNGLDTTYRFEYGPTTSYGQVAPIPDGTLSASNANQSIGIHLTDLTPHVVYHYRLVATNADGTTTAGDHTFNFYPPSCPNENVRQQTQANFLPDCRAYELVSPGDAGGTLLYPGGPNTGHATNPSRLSFSGDWGTIPGGGGGIDGTGDLYVATRNDTGWTTRYVGLPANAAAVDGGPPMGPPSSSYGDLSFPFTRLSNGGTPSDKIQNDVLTDPSMGLFVDWNEGNQGIGQSGRDLSNPTPMASNAPYAWNADGSFNDRWPTNLATVPDGSHAHLDPKGNPTEVEPGGVRALDCPNYVDFTYGYARTIANYCPGDVTASADLSHFVFATAWNRFALDGVLGDPGSVYDNDIGAATVEVASKLAGGGPIPLEPGDQTPGDVLKVPAVSHDGSHILIDAPGVGPCGQAKCVSPICVPGDIARFCPSVPGHLYMRVDGAMTYDVSQGHEVSYVGTNGAATKVYFTSPDHLTGDDTDNSVDLYMWSQATDSLTLVSKGSNDSGNSDSCSADFTTQCGVVTYSNNHYCQQTSGLGGNCVSDNFIAADNGDIYFFSPEQLDGSRGLPNKENLYDYRNGQVQYVTTLTASKTCAENGTPLDCTDTPIARIQVSPDDSHMAFVTLSPVTQYNNAGFQEMYTYDPSTSGVVCVSCIPSGTPPTADVHASQDGLFMTDDGRTAFSTDDALVHADTNKAQDVYEYADGHPQLITPGTGDTRAPATGDAVQGLPGLVGLSADGRDVYFSTFDTLVPQDNNGLFLKFYDAREGGGFPAPPPPPGCEAADECHGAGSNAPVLPTAASNGTPTGTGNVSPEPKAKSRGGKRHGKKHHKRHHRRAAKSGKGGAR